LPSSEKFLGVVVRASEFVGGHFGQFFADVLPDLLEGGFEVGLSIVRGSEGNESRVKAENMSEESLAPIGIIEPFVEVSVYNFFLVKMFVDDINIVFQAFIPKGKAGVESKRSDVVGESVVEKSFGGKGVDNEEIVVEVDKLFSEIGDLVEVDFDETGVEAG
jgi:hypothetical protein